MKKKILIEKNVLLTRIAVLFDDEWVEFYTDSHLEEDFQNKVIVGQIEQVVKNLKAVFVDYGEAKNGLLHIKQIPEAYQTKLHPGARLPVQIVKQNVGDKGHKLTGKISLKGRHLVCLPFENGINISKKIQDNKQRSEIKEALEGVTNNHYAFIVRTHAKDVPLEQLVKDAKELMIKADQFMNTKDYLAKGSILYKEPPLCIQVVMEHLNGPQSLEVICNDEEITAYIKELIEGYGEADRAKVITFSFEEDMMSVYGLQKQMEALLQRKIWLKNGGNMVIDYTEAMTVIDVNSAKAIMTKNPRKSVLDLNLLATKEAILQMLRRNLSGIIIVDLVEMPYLEDKLAVYDYAKKLLTTFQDTRSKVFPLTELGLLQISRATQYTSIPHRLLASCAHCAHPYGQMAEVYDLFLMEKQIKHMAYHTIQKEIYIECKDILLQIIDKFNLQKTLETTYDIKLYLGKIEKTSKKMFLCQFYQR